MALTDIQLYGAALIFLLAERGLELVINARNLRRLSARGGVRLPHDGFLPILLAQVLWIVGLFLEPFYPIGSALSVGPWTWPLLGVWLLAQALRYWCVVTLGQRWSILVITLPNEPLVTRGPYRFLRHPNYLAVAIEFLAFPMAFGLWATVAAGALVGGPALAYRIHREELALRPLRKPPSAEARA